MNTLNEQQLDYLNYMLGSITSSGSMTHIHTRAHTGQYWVTHTRCVTMHAYYPFQANSWQLAIWGAWCVFARARVRHSRARAYEQTPQSHSLAPLWCRQGPSEMHDCSRFKWGNAWLGDYLSGTRRVALHLNEFHCLGFLFIYFTYFHARRNLLSRADLIFHSSLLSVLAAVCCELFWCTAIT